MGSGSWSRDSFCSYSSTSKGGATLDGFGKLTGKGVETNQAVYKQRQVHSELAPYKIVRECCDTNEHPNTIPVILALDVTGSMGNAALEVAKSLNVIMTNLYESVKDVEFCIMGIGDLAYDKSPIQMSQFESDVRIAEHLDKVYFEFGGGGNNFESYTASWYMGLKHTKLDCFNHGKKGIIITLGDEELNPYLPKDELEALTGDTIQSKDSLETKVLFKEVSAFFDIYHINVKHRSYDNALWTKSIKKSFEEIIGEDNYFEANLNSLPDVISEIIIKTRKNVDTINNNTVENVDSANGISW